MLNMVQAYATRDRVPSGHLSGKMPSPEAIRDIPLSSILSSDNDSELLQQEMKLISKRIIVKYFDVFHDIDCVNHIQHAYSHDSAQKSEIVSLNCICYNQ